jgi:hypothetical protein
MSNFDEDRAVFSGHYEVEIVIDRPVAKVWKSFLAMGSWVTSHGIENVQGVPGSVGSITRVSYRKAAEAGMAAPHHHFCKIISLVPERQYVLKTYSEKGGSYGFDIVAFDDGHFTDLGGKTKVVWNVYVEMAGEAVARNPSAMNLEDSREGMLANLKNLKRQVESE